MLAACCATRTHGKRLKHPTLTIARQWVKDRAAMAIAAARYPNGRFSCRCVVVSRRSLTNGTTTSTDTSTITSAANEAPYARHAHPDGRAAARAFSNAAGPHFTQSAHLLEPVHALKRSQAGLPTVDSASVLAYVLPHPCPSAGFKVQSGRHGTVTRACSLVCALFDHIISR